MIAKTRLKIFFSIVLLASVSILAYRLNDFKKKYVNRIYPNVYIDGLEVSGMTQQEVKRIFERKNAELKPLVFSAIYKESTVATFSAQTIGLKYDGETPAIQAFSVGRSKFFLSRNIQLFSSFMKIADYRFQSSLGFDDEPVKEFLRLMEDKYNHPAENALFKFESGRVVNFKKEISGLEIQSTKFLADFEENLKKIKKNQAEMKIRLREKVIKPEITLASANNFGIEEEIATGKSDYRHSIPGRIHNVILATSKFNGVLIPPGEIFSFNKTVGDISANTGYQQAYIIKEGKTVLGDGGGVCQVSTTLFRAALNAGLPIVERHAHAYRVGYYENDMKPGFDATVFSPSVDLKIKNDTPAHILIETEIDEENMTLTFHFYGKKDDRKVEIGNAQLWDVVPPPPDKHQDDPTMKKGETKQIDFAAWGSKASFTYKVIKGKEVAVDAKFYSVYQPWAAVYLVGTAD